jgi:hypothetical protein
MNDASARRSQLKFATTLSSIVTASPSVAAVGPKNLAGWCCEGKHTAAARGKNVMSRPVRRLRAKGEEDHRERIAGQHQQKNVTSLPSMVQEMWRNRKNSAE